ncbi:MAG: hypothetical protein AB1715_00695 [Acidobacteriota bacterium]
MPLAESVRLKRALALLSEVQIFPQVCDLSFEFLSHDLVQSLLQNRSFFLDLAALEKEKIGEKEVTEALDVLTAIPGPPESLALLRRAFSPMREERAFDRPNILCFLVGLKLDEKGQILRQEILDIVNNDVAPRPGSSLSSYRIRLEQGVVDTVVEGAILPSENNAENTAGLFARVKSAGEGLAVIHKKGDEGWRNLNIEDDIRARLEEDLKSGFIVVAPVRAVEINGRPQFGWWRTHPVSGETLGVMGSGYHQDISETFITKTHVPMRVVRVFKTARGTVYSGILGIYSFVLTTVANLMQRIVQDAWLYFDKTIYDYKFLKTLALIQWDIRFYIWNLGSKHP